MPLPQLPPDHSDWVLLLGPGEDLERLAPLLEALESTRGFDRPLGIEVLDDLGQLFHELPARGRLVLHAAWLPLEDLGLVRRFLESSPAWELVLVGLDPGASVPRRLLRFSGSRWFSDPLDLDQLDELLSEPSLVAQAGGNEAFEDDDEEDHDVDYGDSDPLSTALNVALDEDELAAFREDPPDADWTIDESANDEDLAELEALARESGLGENRNGGHDPDFESDEDAVFDEEIERILSLPSMHEGTATTTRTAGSQTAARGLESQAPSLSTSDRSAPSDPFGALLRDVAADGEPELETLDDGDAESEPDAMAAVAVSAPQGSAVAIESGFEPPAPYFKHQVADLADIALRIELALEMARERALQDGDAPALDDVEMEVQRLAQFTRTLGYLSAPPAAGRTRIALGQMVEEMLSVVGNDDHSPRYLWRSDGLLYVRCDKTLMHHALEAVLYLVHHCAGAAGTVRVEGRETAAGHAPPGQVELTLRFPPGPLTDLDPLSAVVPYALRSLLPKLGPNALAAASGILRGQGGELVLLTAGDEWIWRLRLPRA